MERDKVSPGPKAGTTVAVRVGVRVRVAVAVRVGVLVDVTVHVATGLSLGSADNAWPTTNKTATRITAPAAQAHPGNDASRSPHRPPPAESLLHRRC